jgi:tetrahydromethanopterin S-methyltransferase subunit B
MQQRFSHAKSLISDEKGNILLITSFVILGLFLMAVGLVEMGRFLIIREQAQTINDAAVLTGATSKDSTQKWVTIDVHTQHGSYRECQTDSKGNTTCWCVGCGSSTVEDVFGLESDLLDNGGWRRYSLFSCGNCDTPYDTWYTFKNRELIYDMRDIMSQINKLTNSANKTRNNVTQAIDRVLGNLKSKQHRPYTHIYTGVLGGLSLEDKKKYADDESLFVRKYVVDISGFSGKGNLCSTERKEYEDALYGKTSGRKKSLDELFVRYMECVYTVQTGKKAYSSLQSIRSIIDDSLDSVTTLEQQVDDYINTARDTINSPDYRTGQDKAKEATESFLKAATEVKGLNYGPLTGESDSTPRLSPSDIFVYDDASSRYHPSVAMILTAEVPAIFQSITNWPTLSLFDDKERGLRQRVCSQATTFYYDPSGHIQYSAGKRLKSSLNTEEVVNSDYTKYIKVPDDYCKEWRKDNYKTL